MQAEIFGYFASVLIGISLGLIGSGGSILTVPVLVYLFAVNPVAATSYSLFIVGCTAAIGSVSYFRKGLVRIRTAIVFGMPTVIGVLVTRAFIIPAIPAEIMRIDNFPVTKNMLVMVVFSILMMAASFKMIRKDHFETAKEGVKKYQNAMVLLEGLLIGGIAGLVGAGGGFLIIPALLLLFKLPMKEAVGTSLAIIAVNSLIGFFGENSGMSIDWMLLITISAFAVSGIFIGIFLSKKIEGAKLKPIFGWFILIMGIYILLKETIFK